MIWSQVLKSTSFSCFKPVKKGCGAVSLSISVHRATEKIMWILISWFKMTSRFTMFSKMKLRKEYTHYRLLIRQVLHGGKSF